jgi:Ser/Thr protein kinase RdoA (MazF antagonist)
MHTVGAARAATHRRRLDAETFGEQSLAALFATQWIPMELATRYKAAALAIISRARALYRELPVFRIHGDCHPANLLWNEGGPFFLDFDDMVTGPAVQDLWLLVPGRDDDARRRRAKILEGYREMRDFPEKSLALIEPLRGLRILHYSAWIASHWTDPAFPRAFPEFPAFEYWARETTDLERVVGTLGGR